VWEGDRQGEARKAGAGADVAEHAGPGELLDLEPGEAVGDVDVECLFGIPGRGRRIGLGREGLKEALEALGGLVRQPVAAAEAPQRFP